MATLQVYSSARLLKVYFQKLSAGAEKQKTFSGGQNVPSLTGVFPTVLGFGVVQCGREQLASSVLCRCLIKDLDWVGRGCVLSALNSTYAKAYFKMVFNNLAIVVYL